MREYFIAKSTKGQEFIFDRSSMIAVPKTSAEAIANKLNESKYQLKDGQVWHVHQNDWYFNDLIDKEIKRNDSHRLIVRRYHG